MNKCPMCHASIDRARVLYDGIHSDREVESRIPIKQCAFCQVVFSDYTPSQNEALYSEGYYGEEVADKAVNSVAIRLFQQERQRQALGNRRGGMILDIGCGDGTFLSHLSSAWEKWGYEPSALGQEQVKRKKDIRFFDMEAVSLDVLFDVVTLWQVFEHVDDPKALLAKIRLVLKKEGVLFISVPNFESFQARLFRGRWFHLDPIRHIFHYSPIRLKQLLTDAGFDVVGESTFSLEYGAFGWWQSSLNACGFEFNMMYKILKKRKQYKRNFIFFAQVSFQWLISFFVLPLSFFLAVIDSIAGKGSIINLTLKARQ